jgi:hypothetical protein
MPWGGGSVSESPNKTSAAVDASPDSTTLTTAYASGWVSDWISGPAARTARLLMTFGTADATTFEVKLEVEDGSGTDGFTTLRASGGVAVIDEIQLAPAASSSTERYAIQVQIPEVRRFRLRAKKTGGSSTATLTLEYLLDLEA